ncbi:putative glycosidase CRH2 [Entomophthora muscae]|uniref:Glycosidase CRH2 n=1 Tax=Entomophthora muscae TaxID=34485 RepID=A0ACC2TR18_9FUNG|nr:putative glycosidase CRH2 [Entomophthora muscae]
MKLVLSFLLINSALGAGSNAKCTEKKGVCNRYTPCCNSEGWCGKGFEYCGLGCHEEGNFDGVKCFPQAPCKGGDFTFNASRIISESEYKKKGDFKQYDFKVHGDYSVEGDEIVLKMSKSGAGTAIQSTRYVDFGRITAVMKTSRGAGVVSSFITMSDVKDEIDFEWVGKNTTAFQSNWFQEGHFPPWPETHGSTHPQPDSFANYNTYTIDWNPDRIIWIVNGKSIRTYSGKEYPKTPSLFSFGIWDGSSGSNGTREWAGGSVDWSSADMKKDGFYSVRVKSVSVECFREPAFKDEDFILTKAGLVPKRDSAMYGSASFHRPTLLVAFAASLVTLL